MNKQRKVLITITYNEMGIIIDTKAEEVAQPVAKDINVPCTDTISRQAAIDAIDEYIEKNRRPDFIGNMVWVSGVADAMRIVSDLPSVQERKKGRWIEQEDYNLDTYYDCSVCEESWCTVDGTPWENGMNYCPHCGASMMEGAES